MVGQFRLSEEKFSSFLEGGNAMKEVMVWAGIQHSSPPSNSTSPAMV